MNNVFEKTCKHYLGQVRNMDLQSMNRKLGIQGDHGQAVIPLFGRPYRVSDRGISGPSGETPPFDACVILFKYLLLCPAHPREDKEWAAYRDFKDSGPLTVYFRNEAEGAISKYYRGRMGDLRDSGILMGGYTPEADFGCDIALRFDMLPKVPVLMLFYDEDDEFSARCSILYQKRAEDFLDAECLAIGGRLLFTFLKEQDGKRESTEKR